MNSIGQHVHLFRKKRKIPVPEIAHTLKISRQHVYRIEKGATVSLAMLDRISKLVGVPVPELFVEPRFTAKRKTKLKKSA